VVTASGSGAFGVSGGGGKANGCPVKACVSSIIPDDEDADAGASDVDGDGKKKKQKADSDAGASDVGCGCGCKKKKQKDAADPVVDPVTPTTDPVTPDPVTTATDGGGKKKKQKDAADPVVDSVTPTTDPVTSDPVALITTPVSPSFRLGRTNISIEQGTQAQIEKTRRLFTELYNGDKDFASVVNSKTSTGYEIFITDLVNRQTGADNVLGRAVIGGYQMALDDKHLDVSSDESIRFTIAHEMAHSKGLRHADSDFHFWEAALQDFA
jgi:hypothetical protein